MKRTVSFLMIRVLTEQNAKDMAVFVYSTCHLLFSQSLITLRFEYTNCVCHHAELNNTSLVTIVHKMAKIFIFSKR